MLKTYRFALPLLGLWLIGWMILSWPGIQDDALIHLRYADNLFLHHFITYDGVHKSYGASSLLYVTLLAILRAFTASPQLPRAVSSVMHLALVAGLAIAFQTRIPATARAARLAGLILLLLLVMPGAVRWLDDGMETGMGLVVVALMTWLVHRQFVAGVTRLPQFVLLFGVGFLAVMLRTEFLLLCGICSAVLSWGDTTDGSKPSLRRMIADSPRKAALLVGAALALIFIVATMHSLLPDTALAKSHGIGKWRNSLSAFEIVLASAFSFGIGFTVFWIATLYLTVRRAGRLTVPTLLANSVFPLLLVASAVRGQEIQGIRYFAWTYFFSTLWNILELARITPKEDQRAENLAPLYAFLALILLGLPFESYIMHRVVTVRSHTMRVFESQHLEVLSDREGIAWDVGFIGYFTQAKICDMGGLVNGRAAAALSGKDRFAACASSNSDFAFGNSGQLNTLTRVKDLHSWKECGRYDFGNVRSLDTHYLLVKPELANTVCRATGSTPADPDPVIF